MASLSNIHAVDTVHNGDDDKPPIQTTTNTVERSASGASVYPPGAWVSGDSDGQGSASLVDLGEAVVGALGAAGSVAAKYLPASVISTFGGAAYGCESGTNTSDKATMGANANQDGMDGSSDHVPPPTTELTTAFPLPEIGKADTPDHHDAASASSVVPNASAPASELASLTTAAQFASPSIVPSASPPPLRNPGMDAGMEGTSVSNTAITGHDTPSASLTPDTSFSPVFTPAASGTVAPPPSATATGMGKGFVCLGAFDGAGPLAGTLPEGAPVPASTTLVKDPNLNESSSGSAVPSSALSVKSGFVGAGPTTATSPTTTTTATGPVQNGVTPRTSGLEKAGDDLSYLAPHIREHGSTPGVPRTSRFAEDIHAYPTPPDSTTPDRDHDAHSRNSSVSGSASGGAGGSRRLSLVKRIKGEAKIIAGKIKKDEAKVSEGRAILDGEA